MSAARKPLTAPELQSRIVITVPEYAATFGLDERTARRAIRDGQLAAIQIGDTWRIPTRPLLRQCGLDQEDSDNVSGRIPTQEAAAQIHAPNSDTEPRTNYARGTG
jgi:excisionase family DNA binding protein